MSKKNEAAWGALRRPVTPTEAAKLLGVSYRELAAKLDGFTVLTITVRRRKLIPLCELWRLKAAPISS
jgi:hypothetical protein